MSLIRTTLLLSFFALAARAQDASDFLMQQAGGTLPIRRRSMST